MTTQANVQVNRPTLLRDALRGNAIFSMVSGLVMLLGAGQIAPLLGQFSPVELTIIGIVLLPFGAFLWYAAAQMPVSRTVGILAVVLDVLWVAASVAGVVTGFFPLTTVGIWVVLIIADIVGVFAAVQFFALFARPKSARD